MFTNSSRPSLTPEPVASADVCLIVEGCYPYVAGGVSSWLDWLMRSQSELEFAVVAIVADSDADLPPRYEFPDNLKAFSQVRLHEPAGGLGLPRPDRRRPADEAVARALVGLIDGGGVSELATIHSIVNAPGKGLSLRQLMSSRLTWHLVCHVYDAVMPSSSFLHFYWAWRSLFGGLFSTFKSTLPRASVYHTISTGYAGLLAARAALETGRPALITEHGIYTNERRIEILMADWIADTVNKGIALDDERIDLRDVWIRTFEGYARACYQACSAITTLYEDNQRLQLNLGATEDKLMVIANGIEVSRFAELACAAQDARPTMALIGRVVPIKDVKTYIAAADTIRKRVPDLRAFVMGPTDEDPAYYAECTELVRELGLGDCVTFTGGVNLVDYLPSVHVVVLSSLSEAQPLVLLEAGAAGIPCVTTNVGSCREIIEGRSDESPALGRGGSVTDLVAPEQIANAVSALLRNETLRREQGEVLRQRVRRYYESDRARRDYRALYQKFCNRPTAPAIREVA